MIKNVKSFFQSYIEERYEGVGNANGKIIIVKKSLYLSNVIQGYRKGISDCISLYLFSLLIDLLLANQYDTFKLDNGYLNLFLCLMSLNIVCCTGISLIKDNFSIIRLSAYIISLISFLGITFVVYKWSKSSPYEILSVIRVTFTNIVVFLIICLIHRIIVFIKEVELK